MQYHVIYWGCARGLCNRLNEANQSVSADSLSEAEAAVRRLVAESRITLEADWSGPANPYFADAPAKGVMPYVYPALPRRDVTEDFARAASALRDKYTLGPEFAGTLEALIYAGEGVAEFDGERLFLTFPDGTRVVSPLHGYLVNEWSAIRTGARAYTAGPSGHHDPDMDIFPAELMNILHQRMKLEGARAPWTDWGDQKKYIGGVLCREFLPRRK